MVSLNFRVRGYSKQEQVGQLTTSFLNIVIPLYANGKMAITVVLRFSLVHEAFRNLSHMKNLPGKERLVTPTPFLLKAQIRTKSIACSYCAFSDLLRAIEDLPQGV